jgi:hypothetical protein
MSKFNLLEQKKEQMKSKQTIKGLTLCMALVIIGNASSQTRSHQRVTVEEEPSRAWVQSGQDEKLLSKAISARWVAEQKYLESAKVYWKAYQKAEEAYKTVKDAGVNMEVLRDSSSFSDAMARELSQQLQGNLACKAVQAIAGPAAALVCDSAEFADTTFNLAKWFALDIVLVEHAIRNRVIIAKQLKPALEKMNKAKKALSAAQKAIQKNNKRGVRVSSPSNGQLIWDGIIEGKAAPNQKVKVYIFTDRTHFQGECQSDRSGSWKLQAFPTLGTQNTVYAVGFTGDGKVISYSNEQVVSKKWRKPKQVEPGNSRRARR